MCGFLTSSILIDEVSNYTGVILRIACFDLNCPLFTCLDFWHRLSSIEIPPLNLPLFVSLRFITIYVIAIISFYIQVKGFRIRYPCLRQQHYIILINKTNDIYIALFSFQSMNVPGDNFNLLLLSPLSPITLHFLWIGWLRLPRGLLRFLLGR